MLFPAFAGSTRLQPMDSIHICSECYSTGSDLRLRDVADVVSYAVGRWIIDGYYTLGEYSEEMPQGNSKPNGFDPIWKGREGSHFICDKCTTLARDAYDEARQQAAEYRYDVANGFPNDPTGQDAEAHYTWASGSANWGQ